MSAIEEKTSMCSARRCRVGKFVKRGGALVVGFSILGGVGGKVGRPQPRRDNSLDASLPSSWLTINADNTILMRTGKPEMGQGSASAAYAQILAEELNVPFSAITRSSWATPTGRPTAASPPGSSAPAPRTCEGRRLHLPGAARPGLDPARRSRGAPDVKNGVVSGGGKKVTYGQLVGGQAAEPDDPRHRRPARRRT